MICTGMEDNTSIVDVSGIMASDSFDAKILWNNGGDMGIDQNNI